MDFCAPPTGGSRCRTPPAAVTAAVADLFDGQPQGPPEYAIVDLGAGFAGNDQFKANAAKIVESKQAVFRTV